MPPSPDPSAVDRPDGPPPRRRLLNEVAACREPLRLLARAPHLLRAPRGDGRLTIDIPGWFTGEASTAPLRGYLGWLGHDARPWGLGVNGGDVEQTIDRFEVRLERLVGRADGRPAQLVGWSLGGVIARETARRRPDLVDRLVTFGTPAQGGPTHTAGADRVGQTECARIDALQQELNETEPLALPVTAIYTRSDAVVDWRACIDHWALDIRHVEVRSTHFGLGVDPDVWTTVAHSLSSGRHEVVPTAL